MSHPCRAACLPGRCLLKRFLLFLTVVSFVEHFVDADSYLDDKWDPIDQRSTDGARRLYRGTWATIINIGSRLGCQSTRRWAMDGRYYCGFLVPAPYTLRRRIPPCSLRLYLCTC